MIDSSSFIVNHGDRSSILNRIQIRSLDVLKSPIYRLLKNYQAYDETKIASVNKDSVIIIVICNAKKDPQVTFYLVKFEQFNQLPEPTQASTTFKYLCADGQSKTVYVELPFFSSGVVDFGGEAFRGVLCYLAPCLVDDYINRKFVLEAISWPSTVALNRLSFDARANDVLKSVADRYHSWFIADLRDCSLLWGRSHADKTITKWRAIWYAYVTKFSSNCLIPESIDFDSSIMCCHKSAILYDQPTSVRDLIKITFEDHQQVNLDKLLSPKNVCDPTLIGKVISDYIYRRMALKFDVRGVKEFLLDQYEVVNLISGEEHDLSVCGSNQLFMVFTVFDPDSLLDFKFFDASDDKAKFIVGVPARLDPCLCGRRKPIVGKDTMVYMFSTEHLRGISKISMLTNRSTFVASARFLIVKFRIMSDFYHLIDRTDLKHCTVDVPTMSGLDKKLVIDYTVPNLVRQKVWTSRIGNLMAALDFSLRILSQADADGDKPVALTKSRVEDIDTGVEVVMKSDLIKFAITRLIQCQLNLFMTSQSTVYQSLYDEIDSDYLMTLIASSSMKRSRLNNLKRCNEVRLAELIYGQHTYNLLAGLNLLSYHVDGTTAPLVLPFVLKYCVPRSVLATEAASLPLRVEDVAIDSDVILVIDDD